MIANLLPNPLQVLCSFLLAWWFALISVFAVALFIALLVVDGVKELRSMIFERGVF
jgi:uncharacterized RDD family membrane protein YckC